MTGWLQVIGWAWIVSLVEAGILVGAVWLALKVVPGDEPARRHGIAFGGLVALLAAFTVTTSFLLADWRTHVDCWERAAAPGVVAPAECRPHGVTDAAEPAPGEPKVQAVLGGFLAVAVPAPEPARRLALLGGGAAGAAGALWLLAALLVAGREAWRRHVLRGVLGEARRVSDPEVASLFRELVAELGIRTRVELGVSSSVDTPCVAGVVRPVILMPAGLLDALDPGELRAVLTHELGHVRRRDPLKTALQSAARFLLLFNPFVPWLTRRIREEREAACDRFATAHGTLSRREYAEVLLVLEGFRSLPRASEPALPLLGERTLSGRVRRLFASPARGGSRWRWLMAVVVLSLGAALLARASTSTAALGSWAVMAEDVARREAPAP